MCNPAYEHVHSDSVYKIWTKIEAETNDERISAFTNEIVGSTVLSMHNKEAYLITACIFDKSLRDVFITHNGNEISLMDYYRSVCIYIQTKKKNYVE